MGRGRFDHGGRARPRRNPGRRRSAAGIRASVLALLVLGTSMLAPTPHASALEQPIGDAFATVETSPVANSGDAADDIAIWRNPLDPAASLVIGNDKLGALETYDLSGSLVQRFDGGFYGNVDNARRSRREEGPSTSLSPIGWGSGSTASIPPRGSSRTSPTPRPAASPLRSGEKGSVSTRAVPLDRCMYS